MIPDIAGLLAIAPALARDMGQLAVDIQTGSVLTLAIAAILAAVSAAVSALRAARLRDLAALLGGISMLAAMVLVAPVGLMLAFEGVLTFLVVVAGSLALGDGGGPGDQPAGEPGRARSCPVGHQGEESTTADGEPDEIDMTNP